jgi:hypothetical protein
MREDKPIVRWVRSRVIFLRSLPANAALSMLFGQESNYLYVYVRQPRQKLGEQPTCLASSSPSRASASPGLKELDLQESQEGSA